MTLTLRYPIFVIASRDGVVVVKTDGKDCIMLFHTRDLADRQIQSIQATHPALGSLQALPVPDAEALREGIKGLPADVTCAVWDPTGTPGRFAHHCLDELFSAEESR